MSEKREMVEDELGAIIEKVFDKKVDEAKGRLSKHFTRLLKIIVLLDVEIYNIGEHVEEIKNNELAEWVESMRMWFAGMPTIPKFEKFEKKEKNTKRR